MSLSTRVGTIELAADEVRLAVVKTGGKIPKALELHRVPVVYAEEDERHDAYVVALRDAVSRVKTNPTVYVLCASSAHSITRQLTIPFKGRRRVAEAVRFELEPYLAFPIDELIVDYLHVREIEGETQVLCVGIRREYLEIDAAVFEEAAVPPEGIGLDAVGLTQLWQAQVGHFSGLNAVLHLRAGNAVLSVTADKHLAYVRHMTLPASRFHENPQQASRDVNKLLRAFAAGWGGEAEIASLTVTGVRLYDDERALFEAESSIPVHFVELLNGVTDIPADEAAESGGDEAAVSEAHEQRWAACIGVAAGAAGAPFSLDFLKEDLDVTRPRRGLVTHAVFSAALALLAIAGYAGYAYMDYQANQSEIDRLGESVWQELRAIYPELDGAQTRASNDVGGLISFQRLQEAAEAENEVKDAVSMDLFTGPNLLDVLCVLADHMPDDKVGISELTLTLTKNTELTVSGEDKDSGSFNEIFKRLQESEIIDVDPNPKRASREGKETFQFTASK